MAFPHDFTWGVATSAYQIEGATRQGRRAPSIWDRFSHTPGKVKGGETGDIACDHYNRWREDIGHMKELGVGAYRFSIAWPRIQPEGRGWINPEGLDHYSALIDGLLEAGIEPWPTLYHWDLPLMLEERGGWRSRDTAWRFADYAEAVIRRIGDRARHVATLNEPAVTSWLGHGIGIHAPGFASERALLASIHHQNLAHGLAVQAMRAHDGGLRLSCVHVGAPVRPAEPERDNEEAADIFSTFWNRAFADPQWLGKYPERLAEPMREWIEPEDMAQIHQPLDWYGINHYSPLYAARDPEGPLGVRIAAPTPDRPVTGIGWEVDPSAFAETLMEIARRYDMPPIYVTENGLGQPESPGKDGTVADHERIDYLRAYIDTLRQSVESGVDVRGYFAWTLMDNFEWAEGYDARFGLMSLAPETLNRRPKASYHWYQQLIDSNGERL
ncbi:GH1 family beta-glucosidase [Radicibacter daui]|uniref:GH1 family beta-glucosidase n=1 Tax=Radicibacter daui TaxID=3064829 RepID=UPI004046A751